MANNTDKHQEIASTGKRKQIEPDICDLTRVFDFKPHHNREEDVLGIFPKANGEFGENDYDFDVYSTLMLQKTLDATELAFMDRYEAYQTYLTGI